MTKKELGDGTIVDLDPTEQSEYDANVLAIPARLEQQRITDISNERDKRLDALNTGNERVATMQTRTQVIARKHRLGIALTAREEATEADLDALSDAAVDIADIAEDAINDGTLLADVAWPA